MSSKHIFNVAHNNNPFPAVQTNAAPRSFSGIVVSTPLTDYRVYHTRRELWERMLADNMFSGASTNAQTFYTQEVNTGVGRFAMVDKALSTNDVSNAQIYNSFAAANNFELQQQQVNNVKIKMADTSQNSPLTPSDTAVLVTAANGCPETDGTAVYEARTLLNMIYGQQLHYASNCLSGNLYRLTSATIIRDEKINFTIVPNPNQGRFKLQFNADSGINSVEICNNLGQLVSSQVVTESGSELNVDALTAGIYIVKVLSNGTHLSSQKLIINK